MIFEDKNIKIPTENVSVYFIHYNKYRYAHKFVTQVVFKGFQYYCFIL